MRSDGIYRTGDLYGILLHSSCYDCRSMRSGASRNQFAAQAMDWGSDCRGNHILCSGDIGFTGICFRIENSVASFFYCRQSAMVAMDRWIFGSFSRCNYYYSSAENGRGNHDRFSDCRTNACESGAGSLRPDWLRYPTGKSYQDYRCCPSHCWSRAHKKVLKSMAAYRKLPESVCSNTVVLSLDKSNRIVLHCHFRENHRSDRFF
jgi:hypothetical protein